MGVDCQLLTVVGRGWLRNVPVSKWFSLPLVILSALLINLAVAYPVLAQVAQGMAGPFAQPNVITEHNLLSQVVNPQIAQAPPTVIPTDVTQSGLSTAKEMSYSPLKFKLFSMLPERLWFDSSTEVTQRVETNVFFVDHPKKADYVFRTLPNVTLGWNLFSHTAIYCNYFVIKDVFAVHEVLTPPTTQSVSLGFRQEIPIGNRTSLQLDFQSRELWQARHLHQADLIPTLTVSRVITPKFVVFGSALLQMRGREYFTGPNRELDPFFTVGAIYRHNSWTFIANNTYVNNFRNHNAIPPISNQSMIADFEINRPISAKRPWVVAFFRAEPIWNWGAHGAPGLSGFDFRLFSGIRLGFSKPAFNADINKMQQQIMESEDTSTPNAGQTGTTNSPQQEPAKQ